MTGVAFDFVPEALRYPGAFVEVDGSKAGLGDDIPAVLIVGQKLATGNAAAGEIVLVAGIQDAIDKAGAGSMLAQMVKAYRAIDKSLDVYILPVADNVAGVQATGTITINAVATENGTLSLYIAGKLVSSAVAVGQTVAQLAATLAAAVNATADLPVTAAAALGVVTLTARHKGTCGNNIDLRLNIYGEETPAGLGVAIAAMANGAGDPVPGDVNAILGQRWYKYVVLGINDAATLAAWHDVAKSHYQPPVQQGFRLFTTFRGDYATAAAFGITKNYEHLANLSLGINPTSTWEAAAIVGAAAAPHLYNNPVESLEGVSLSGMIGLSYHDFTQANSLLFKGMSIMQIGRDGSCSIKRLISMYQFRPDGSTDDAYLDINAAEVMERIRYTQRIEAIKAFTGTAAAKTNEGYRPGLRITTEDSVRALLLRVYQDTLMRTNGWVQDYGYYKSTLVVEQDPLNPSRFNYVDKPVILSPFYILAGRSQFRKVAE